MKKSTIAACLHIINNPKDYIAVIADNHKWLRHEIYYLLEHLGYDLDDSLHDTIVTTEGGRMIFMPKDKSFFKGVRVDFAVVVGPTNVEEREKIMPIVSVRNHEIVELEKLSETSIYDNPEFASSLPERVIHTND